MGWDAADRLAHPSIENDILLHELISMKFTQNLGYVLFRVAALLLLGSILADLQGSNSQLYKFIELVVFRLEMNMLY